MPNIVDFPRQLSAASIAKALVNPNCKCEECEEVRERKKQIGTELFNIAKLGGPGIEAQRTALINELVGITTPIDWN